VGWEELGHRLLPKPHANNHNFLALSLNVERDRVIGSCLCQCQKPSCAISFFHFQVSRYSLLAVSTSRTRQHDLTAAAAAGGLLALLLRAAVGCSWLLLVAVYFDGAVASILSVCSCTLRGKMKSTVVVAVAGWYDC